MVVWICWELFTVEMSTHTTTKSAWRANPENWLMDDLSIEFIKDSIDSNPFQYKYWVCLNYEMNDYQWSVDETDLDTRLNEVKSYLDHLSSRQNTHLAVWCGAYLEWEKPHFHLIICSEKPLKIQKAKDAWRHGRPHNQQIKIYEPNFCTERGIPAEHHCVFYLYRFHRAERARRLHCPCKKSSCRNGNCEYND